MENYQSWLMTGIALATIYGTNGRHIFHEISSQSDKYDKVKTDDFYNTFLEREVSYFSSKQQWAIIQDVIAMRKKQDEKYGADQDHNPEIWLSILAEEFGEVSKDVVDSLFQKDKFIKSMHIRRVRQELIDLAAVSVAFIEWIDRSEHSRRPFMSESTNAIIDIGNLDQLFLKQEFELLKSKVDKDTIASTTQTKPLSFEDNPYNCFGRKPHRMDFDANETDDYRERHFNWMSWNDTNIGNWIELYNELNPKDKIL